MKELPGDHWLAKQVEDAKASLQKIPMRYRPVIHAATRQADCTLPNCIIHTEPPRENYYYD